MKNETNVPSKEAALESLSRVFGEAKAEKIWKEACAVCKCATDNVALEDLDVIFRHLSRQSGILGLQGMRLRMKLMAYQNTVLLQTTAA